MKEFLNYYNDELLFLRKKGGEFAKKHPEIARRLDIKNGESTDPQTERIIESVAFMSAKLNQKIDDNAQSIAFHLLSALYPNLINIFPPCGVVKFETERSPSIAGCINIKTWTSLFVNTNEGVECQFRTLYPISIYPISISNIELIKVERQIGGIDGWALKIRIETNSVPLEMMDLSDLLFHINSNIISDALMIYEALFSNPDRNVFLKVGTQRIKLDNRNMVQCGFDDSEAVCPVSPYSTNSLQLFQEALHFKRKFMFFRILGLGEAIRHSGEQNLSEISIIIDVDVSDDRLLEIVNRDALTLNAVPIVNLFPVTSDPFRFDGTHTKYLLLADQARDASIEIHSISELHIINNDTKEDEIVQPYFSLAIDTDTNVVHDLFWLYSKDPSELKHLGGFDTYISLVDTKMNPHKVYADVVYAKTLCTNRFAAREIPVMSKMYVDNVETAGYYGTLLYKTTPPISFSAEATNLWNLVSQLAATHISIAEAENLLNVVRKIIGIFAAGDDVKAAELLRGIKGASVDDIVSRFGKDAWRGFVRGREIAMDVDGENSPSNFLLGCIVNRYLSDTVSINSFVKLKMHSTAIGKTLATWHSTSGSKELL
ncbi:MAG: type VI secretion system baseplate subunit TssF [Alphaproteobacteria bacterium]|nr:type VI secretion system baseplate subunit TssF [Alphaproteobacteria bacterium]